MSLIQPEFEYVDRAAETIRYLEHGWPTELCRWHSHPEYELHLIVATSGRAFIGDFIGEFHAGSLFLTGPNLPHNWVTDELNNEGRVDIRDMLVQFSQDSIDQLMDAFPEFGELAPMFELARSGIEFENYNPTFARGHLESIRDARGPERIVAFLRFLIRIGEHAEKRALSIVSMTEPEGNGKTLRVAEVVDHIARNFADKMTLNDAAAMAGMSPTAFSRNFQRVTGKSFIDFVNRVRIGQACSMLYATDEQISTICYEVGFQNLANFNRHFLKMKNMTPTAYRELARSDLAPKESTSS